MIARLLPHFYLSLTNRLQDHLPLQLSGAYYCLWLPIGRALPAAVLVDGGRPPTLLPVVVVMGRVGQQGGLPSSSLPARPLPAADHYSGRADP